MSSAKGLKPKSTLSTKILRDPLLDADLMAAEDAVRGDGRNAVYVVWVSLSRGFDLSDADIGGRMGRG